MYRARFTTNPNIPRPNLLQIPIYRAPIYRKPRYTVAIPFLPNSAVNRGITVLGEMLPGDEGDVPSRVYNNSII